MALATAVGADTAQLHRLLARRSEGIGQGGDHHHEPEGSEDPYRVNPEQHQAEAGEDTDAADEVVAMGGAAHHGLHLRGEPRVLGIERLLHLIEELLFTLRQRHDGLQLHPFRRRRRRRWRFVPSNGLERVVLVHPL